MKQTVLQTRFIKPFSKGQITIPKNYRDYLGINDKRWVMISLFKDQILLRPVKDVAEKRGISPKLEPKAYRKVLLKIRGDWFDEKELNRTRRGVEKRLAENEKSLA